MGNFITYGVTEMLDNDQKFIIDSDRTGPGSITAKDAASSFLSKWSGFETFEEAVQNTISNNQEFIDRDTAIRSETAELKKKIVTTFPAKDASGAVATFESEFEDAPLKSCIVRVEPVQDLHGYDSPWPAGGGKNLLPCPFDTASGTSFGGLTVTYTDDGVITVKGTKTSSGSWTLKKMKLPAGTYTVYTNAELPSGMSLRVYHAASNTTYANTRLFPVTFTLTEELELIVYILTQANLTGDVDITFRPQIEVGSIATSWTPYSNECPITGWTGCEVQRSGKNVWNGELINGYVDLSDYIVVGETYTVTAEMINSTTPTFCYIRKKKPSESEYTNVGFVIANTTVRAITFTVEAGYKYYIYCNSSYINVKNVMLELGSTATPYEPYTGQTYPITFPTEAGTIYGAYVDVTGGELVVTHAEVDMGTLTWSKYGSSTIYYTSVTGKAVGNTNIISDTFFLDAVAIANMANGSMRGYSTNSNVYFRQDECVDLSAWTTWLTNHHPQLCYKLAEPIHYPLTPTEIKTLLGQNNVWADCGDTEVEYLMSDVSWYVEKKLRAFQSILAGVEDSETSSKNYSTNTYLIFNDDIYRVTKTITAGETIEEGVNVTKTTVAEQLMALAQA